MSQNAALRSRRLVMCSGRCRHLAVPTAVYMQCWWSGSHGGFTFPTSTNRKPTIDQSRSVTGRCVRLKSQKTEVTVIISPLPRKKPTKDKNHTGN